MMSKIIKKMFVFVLLGWLSVCARFVCLFICFSVNVGKSVPECMPKWSENRSKIDQNRCQNIIKEKTKNLQNHLFFIVFLKPWPPQDELEIDQKSIKK